MERIPLYSYEGNLVQFISTARLKRLDENGRVIKIVRHKKGRIARAILARMPGEPRPVHLKQYIGTKYCLRENLADGHHCFRLRGLGDEPFADKDLAPDEVRPLFLTVARECLRQVVVNQRTSGGSAAATELTERRPSVVGAAVRCRSM